MNQNHAPPPDFVLSNRQVVVLALVGEGLFMIIAAVWARARNLNLPLDFSAVAILIGIAAAMPLVFFSIFIVEKFGFGFGIWAFTLSRHSCNMLRKRST